MKVTNDVNDEQAALLAVEGPDTLLMRMLGQPATDNNRFAAVVVGELFESKDGNGISCVMFAGQLGRAPVAARSTIELSGAHAGQKVVLVFEDADPTKPIIIGVLREGRRSTLDEPSSAFEVEADGERVTIRARTQLVLRCGEASITLTRAGKVLIKGEYVSSRSAGVNRIRGGSVQIN